ncbi:hemimethylated DNA-binding protein yccV like domain-containing protein [Phthorimaea operculella]|nr:hemimethylated DNA-binding protein yccV like domain-containing protein [Phthorimaea operculella]
MELLLKFVPSNPLRLTASRILLTHVAHYTRLAEVGKLESPKTSGKYDTGQLILHKVFGYRGVILFPWLARVYDRDVTNKKESTEAAGNTEGSGDSLSNVGKEVKGRTHTFYQVLIDTRDAPYIHVTSLSRIPSDCDTRQARSALAFVGDVLPGESGRGEKRK